jgi:hypothetical protein
MLGRQSYRAMPTLGGSVEPLVMLYPSFKRCESIQGIPRGVLEDHTG